MADDGGWAHTPPLNWCFDCGKALWVYSGARRADTMLGPIALCVECARRHPGNVEIDWDGAAIGWRDKQHWRGAGRKGKR